MPDANPPRITPNHWQEAFATLALETPALGGWEALAPRLQVRHRRWQEWLAVAAMLLFAVALPWRQFWQHEAASGSTALTVRAPSSAVAGLIRDTAPDVRSQPTRQEPITAPPLPRSRVAVPEPVAATRQRIRRNFPAQTRIAHSENPQALPAIPMQLASVSGAELTRLYAESARLEAVLALARDDHVASASAAVLGDAYDAQVADIDSALMQPALSDAQRTGLWRERIAALRQLAGFESGQRMLAVWGQRDDARLVSID